MSTKKPSTTDKDVQSNSPAVAIFQWLTYVFWGVTAALSVALVAFSTELAVSGYSNMLNSVIFVIAATIVVLPLALVFDYFFSRYERDHKVGIGMVLMVVHAVLAALLAVIALATAVFSLVSMLVFVDDANDMISTLSAAGAAVVLFGLIFVRIMRPVTKSRLRLVVRSLLFVLVSALLVWAIVGPAAQVVMRQQDERTVWALQSTPNIISSYVLANGSLPEKLEDALSYSYSGDTGVNALERNLENGRVTYTPNVLAPLAEEDLTTFYYEVCATFDYADESRDQYTYGMAADDNGFSETFTKISTEAGRSCYNLKFTNFNDSVKPL